MTAKVAASVRDGGTVLVYGALVLSPVSDLHVVSTQKHPRCTVRLAPCITASAFSAFWLK